MGSRVDWEVWEALGMQVSRIHLIFLSNSLAVELDLVEADKALEEIEHNKAVMSVQTWLLSSMRLCLVSGDLTPLCRISALGFVPDWWSILTSTDVTLAECKSVWITFGFYKNPLYRVIHPDGTVAEQQSVTFSWNCESPVRSITVCNIASKYKMQGSSKRGAPDTNTNMETNCHTS